MKSFAKNFGKLNQLVGEKFSYLSKHELNEDFKRMERQTEIRRYGMETILETCNKFIRTLEKTKEGSDRQKRLPVDLLGRSMIAFGSDLNEVALADNESDQDYAKALTRLGEVEISIGNIQMEFACQVRNIFLQDMEKFMNDMKTYKQLRGKLESRRLDFDAKSNRLQKAKKEKPEWDEELRIAQQKYEDTLDEIGQLMISLNNREDQHLASLFDFLDAQHCFHEKAAKSLATLRCDMKESIATQRFSAESKMTTNLAACMIDSNCQKKLVRANYSFLAENSNELSIQQGDIIVVHQEIDNWYVGKLRGKVGLFPANYCEILQENHESIDSVAGET